LALPGNTLG